VLKTLPSPSPATHNDTDGQTNPVTPSSGDAVAGKIGTGGLHHNRPSASPPLHPDNRNVAAVTSTTKHRRASDPIMQP
jgi:hypothetical protein